MTGHFITVNNIKLNYIEEGTGKLVILLHGFPEFWYSWRNQIPVLSKKYHVVAPDMRGYNISDKPKGIKNYKLDILAEDIRQLIKALGAEKAIVVGHDWGAAVAWALASLHPEVVEKLVVINVPHPAEMKKALYGFNVRQLIRSYYIFFFQLPWLPEMFIGRDLYSMFEKTFTSFSPTHKCPSPEEIDRYVVAYSEPGALTATINYYRAALRYPVSLKRDTPLPMPVLMIWGEQDKALGKELTKDTAKYCKQFEVVYDALSGHFIQHDNPVLVNEKLLAFFSK
jgi:pimeloyl-ACP methyl ester carboxylesterase